MSGHRHHGRTGRIRHFKVLCKRLRALKIERPTLVIASDTPFLIFADGAIYLGERSPMELLSRSQCTDEFFLEDEIEMVAAKLRRGKYKRSELRQLGSMCSELSKRVKHGWFTLDTGTARFLREHNQLN